MLITNFMTENSQVYFFKKPTDLGTGIWHTRISFLGEIQEDKFYQRMIEDRFPEQGAKYLVACQSQDLQETASQLEQTTDRPYLGEWSLSTRFAPGNVESMAKVILGVKRVEAAASE